MEKSPDAFRTISEVAEWLDIPTHVLRFWESRFSQIKPVKRAGGRRYYRPSDMRLIGGVKVLLHDQGMTIRGVQKLLREQGVKHVSSFTPMLSGETGDDEDAVIEHNSVAAVSDDSVVAPPSSAARQTHAAEPAPEPEASEPVASTGQDDAPEDIDQSDDAGFDLPSRQIETPDIAARDAEDDDAAHDSEPGYAARLTLAHAGKLAAHREDLRAIRERLSALRGRMG